MRLDPREGGEGAGERASKHAREGACPSARLGTGDRGPGASACPCPTRAAAPLPALACVSEGSAPASPHGVPTPSPRSSPLPQIGPYLRVAATPPASRHARAIVSMPSARRDLPYPRSAALRLLRASLVVSRPVPPLSSRWWQPPPRLRRIPLYSVLLIFPADAGFRRPRQRPAVPPS